MDTAVINRTCLDCEHGKVDLSHRGVHCLKTDQTVVQWYTAPQTCKDFKEETRMSQERDCNTCQHHVQAGSLDDAPGVCWSCTSSETRGGPVLPSWKPIQFTGLVEEKLPGGLVQADLPAIGQQVGGSHYTGLAIQPMEFSIANGLNACQHTAVKYIVRKKGDKAKRVQDLDKAIHTLQMYKQFIQEGRLPD